MREILFRGKPKNQNEFYHFSNVWRDCIKDGFVIGSLIVAADRYYICVSTIGVNKSAINNGIVSMIEVIPETVGEYTGLTDKNDKKIFEGDIVKEDCVHNGEVQIYGRKWVVYFDKGVFFGWRKGYKSCGLSKFIPNISGIEVIGNIHDNPELLKEADDDN